MKSNIIVPNCKYSMEFYSTKESAHSTQFHSIPQVKKKNLGKMVKDIPTRLIATGKLIPGFGDPASVSPLQYESFTCWSLP